ncbi:MAG: chitobiase/beta-hexosaminidase C-terminal domain-containing protein, partial [Lachnospiraceae bacterium]
YGNVSTTFSFINDSAKAFTYPASNLNLTDVLFASSAKAATSDTAVSGEIAQGKAMTLRLNGGGKDIGTVTCNADVGQINAKKGNTAGNVALVVQGNDGTKDWYYSKQISGTDNVIVNASDIAAESNTPSDIDLANCKIWLEVTEDSVAYAVEATATKDVVKTDISSVEVTGIDTPVSNTALDTSAVCATQGVSTTAPVVTWTPNHTNAGYNTSYTASVTLAASANYEFTDSVIVTINGNSASVTKNEDGTLTAIYTFPVTAKDKLTSITAPGAVTVANGTAYYKDMNLPTQVNIVTEGNTVDKADVTWDTASGNYDPSVLTEQVVTLNGTVTCPENIDANGVPLTTRITITVSAAGIVGAPTPSVESGTYTENQKVALESSTEGATIYYTTDGAEPGRTTGTRYTGPITVPGTEGQSITTTLKAIAVKDGMQDSEVKTFTYTINIPKPIVKHTITATAGANGSISPSGKVEVVEGADQAFSITANDGYEIESLKVDGAAVSTATSYIFRNVRAAHTIEATFKQKITVEKPSIGKQPQNVSVKAGEQATFTVAATGTDLKYQWQIDRNDGKGFADIAGADRASYTTSAVDKNCNGYKYQCVISNSAGSVTTGAATLTVTEDVTPPVQPTVKKPGISKQPQNVSVKAGEQATFTVKATGTDLTYQWQINRNDGKGFVDITGADKASYTTGVADMLCNGYKYQCVISNSAGSVTTNAATLTVTESTTPSPDPVSYKILDGANSSWTENTDGSLTIRGNGEMEKFQNVKVDGKIIDKKNYTVTKGSTIITLKVDYLKTLATGDHTFEIVWTDGSATTKFAVAKNKSGDNNKNNNNNNKKNNSNNAKNNQTTQKNPTDTKKKEQSVTAPKTGDTSDMTLWTTLLIVSFAGAAGIVVRRNNKTCK